MPDILGYARVSTGAQDRDAQKHRLKASGAIRIVEEVVSGRNFDRPGLTNLINYARPGDVG